ncbi:MAG: hypothetical protein BGP06_08095 [Rhizobiales bacterium 65-9]|nr:DUF4112 domain-containing protein [Hyphomicrobiales bacterium]OJY33890.1 MAG: hypothetical protein BGP06_08095 [Rhizobiales bacterium 65-9]
MSTSYAGDWSDAQPQFKPAESRSDARRREEQALARLAFVARVMDSAVRIPGVNIRFGVDAALGLVPAIGDMLAGAVAAWIVFEARRLGAPPLLVARMVANVMVDTVFGAVPLVGDAFDVAFKANIRNVELLRRHLDSQRVTIDAQATAD